MGGSIHVGDGQVQIKNGTVTAGGDLSCERALKVGRSYYSTGATLSVGGSIHVNAVNYYYNYGSGSDTDTDI